VIAPPLGTILPFSSEQDRSLGKILEIPTLTQEDILKQFITIKENKNLAFIGYAQGENEKTYAEYGIERARELIINLSHIADYVIFDTSSYIHNDILTKTAIKLADETIRLCGSDLKSISYFKSVLPLIREKSYNLSSQIKILSKIEDFEPRAIITNHYGDISYGLSYTKEIQNQYREGLLFNHLEDKESKGYNDTLKDLVEKITGEIKEEKVRKKFLLPKLMKKGCNKND
jgi:MinD-like ATPase involved in chromosome partitioning or flagellar assembly